MRDRTIVITGATSFIGSALIRRLLKEDTCRIVAVTAPDSLRKDRICQSDRVHIIESDLADIDHIEPHCMENVDCIYHIGWTSRFANARYNLEGQIQNVVYLEKLIGWADKVGCKKILGVGSQAECGRISSALSELTPDHPETSYAVAKCRAYAKGMELCGRYGIKFFWPRLLSAYGPGDKMRTMIMSCLDAAVYKKKIEFTKCEQIWDYIYVDDVADALIKIVKEGDPGVKYTIASGQGRPLRDYICEIAEITGASWLLEGIGKIVYAEDQVMYLTGDIQRLAEDTGFEPKVSFDKGIKETLRVDFAK